jgi:serine/threonine-protein kinase
VDVSIGNALVAVPSLAGLPLAEADSLLRAHGLTPGTPLASYSSTVPNGTIINWNPKTTWPVDTPSKPIDIVVSEGSEFVTMPDVVTGQPTYATALATLQGAGITDVNQTQTYSNTVPEGDVISTTPAAGAQADRAKAVTVDVSKGPQTVAVPNVGGDSIGTAEKILEQAGLQVAVYGLPGASQVIDQRPSPGTQVPLGTTVQLAVF